MDVVVNEFLAVAGARLTYERRADSIDLVWVPCVHAEPPAARRSALVGRAAA